MKRHVAAIAAYAVALNACSTTRVPLELPMDVVATVSKPRYTGWKLDHCAADESTDATTPCVSIGGEIYKAILSDVRTTDGRRIASSLTIGFPAHALRRDFRARKRLHLVKASDGLRNDTGIEYIANRWE
jgi:hypothetical protein